jgi:hypothetical protein
MGNMKSNFSGYEKPKEKASQTDLSKYFIQTTEIQLNTSEDIMLNENRSIIN